MSAQPIPLPTLTLIEQVWWVGFFLVWFVSFSISGKVSRQKRPPPQARSKQKSGTKRKANTKQNTKPRTKPKKKKKKKQAIRPDIKPEYEPPKLSEYEKRIAEEYFARRDFGQRNRVYD